MTTEQGTESRISFVYALEGDIDEIDLFAVSETLLRLGQLVQQSNRLIHPLADPIGVNVRPFRKGSFVVNIVLAAQSHPIQAGLAVMLPFAPQIIETLKALGLVADVKESALSLLKKLRGRSAKVEKAEGGEYRYTVEGDDESISVSGNVHQLVQNQQITNNISYVVGRPLADPRVSAVSSYVEGQERSTGVRTTRDEASKLGEPPRSVAADDMSMSSEATVWLKPTRVKLNGDGTRWVFLRGERDKVIADVEDYDFLMNVSVGTVNLNGIVILKVELRSSQELAGGTLKTSHVVTKVLEIKTVNPGSD